MGHLINEIKDSLGKLRSWNIEYVKRNANNAAHFLAYKVIFSVINRVGVEKISNCFYDIVTNKQ
jgi:hypothetical protein